MMMDKIDYLFKVRDDVSTSLIVDAIYKGMGYKGIDIDKIIEIYDLKGCSTIKEVENKIHQQTLNDKEKIDNLLNKLNTMWNSVKTRFFDCLSESLEIKINKNTLFNSYCYLQALPINELDRNGNIIYLDYNRPIDEVFKNFIVLVAKSILLDKWDNLNGDIFSHSYESQNKIWLFADIAIDAIFAETHLSKLCSYPSYRYFYNLSINNVLFMFQFRKMYKKMEIDEFLNQVYLFVYQNYTTLSKLRNYLY